MSILHYLKKIDLKLLDEELGETVPDNSRICEIKELIENSDLFKTDKEFVRGVVKSIVEDRTTKELNNQSALEIEKIKLAQLEKEIELQRLKSQSLPGERTSAPLSVENLIKRIKTLTIPVPEKPEALHLFFTSLEKAFATKGVPNGLQAEILINLLGVKANNVLTHATEEELSDYEKLKEIFLAEFQPTPRECLSNFKNAQRLPNESHMQFASRLTATFEYYCRVRELKKDFKRLCDLIVADKLYETSDFKTKEYIGVGEAVLDNESLDLTHIFDSSLRGQVQHLVKGYEPAKEPKGTDLRLNVVLRDEIPVSQRSRRMPFAEQKIVDKQIDEWLEKGIIKPSCSDYASPILLTKKRDGTHRLCVDFRQLNQKGVKDSFPIAQVEEVLDHLGDAKVFSTLDLKNRFFPCTS
ncbi:hypothetical protein AVEN_45865-1 [Araneus ventricosus]|uniref:Retrovirus-related Pol polyprotein from transposon 412 n=1 Tax=Araneus ventricosus TaxID=182803 RepID=A0A4Y2MRJ5_ARAVE|nr:hypothetical protein AVEN_45865-1 [Araneus ventricosus]